MNNKKCKLDHEMRPFNNEWELKYFFICQNNKCLC